MERSNAIIFHLNRERIRLEITKAFAQVITDHAVHYKDAVGVHGRGKNFSSGQITPFIPCNNSAGFQPLKVRRELRYELGAVGRLTGDAIDLTRVLDQALA